MMSWHKHLYFGKSPDFSILNHNIFLKLQTTAKLTCIGCYFCLEAHLQWKQGFNIHINHRVIFTFAFSLPFYLPQGKNVRLDMCWGRDPCLLYMFCFVKHHVHWWLHSCDQIKSTVQASQLPVVIWLFNIYRSTPLPALATDGRAEVVYSKCSTLQNE